MRRIILTLSVTYILLCVGCAANPTKEEIFTSQIRDINASIKTLEKSGFLWQKEAQNDNMLSIEIKKAISALNCDYSQIIQHNGATDSSRGKKCKFEQGLQILKRAGKIKKAALKQMETQSHAFPIYEATRAYKH